VKKTKDTTQKTGEFSIEIVGNFGLIFTNTLKFNQEINITVFLVVIGDI
jgi:hypothetical protein